MARFLGAEKQRERSNVGGFAQPTQTVLGRRLLFQFFYRFSRCFRSLLQQLIEMLGLGRAEVDDIEYSRVRRPISCPAGVVPPYAVPRMEQCFIFVPDPIGFGLVENLARPGGNAAGLSLVACDVRDLVAVEGKADNDFGRRPSGLRF